MIISTILFIDSILSNKALKMSSELSTSLISLLISSLDDQNFRNLEILSETEEAETVFESIPTKEDIPLYMANQSQTSEILNEKTE